VADNQLKSENPARARTAIPYWLALCFLVIGALSWAGSSVAGRAASGNIPPFTLSFIRWSCVALLFLLVSGRQTWAERHIIAPHLPLMAAFAFFGVVGFTVPYYVGLQFTVAVNASLMNASGTLWIVGTAFLMTGALITRKQALGVACGFSGTLMIVLRADVSVLSNFTINIGDILVLVAFFSWAVYTVMLRWKPSEIGEMPFLTVMTCMAVVMISPLYVVDLVQGKSFDAQIGNLGIIAYAVIFPSFLSYILWNRAVPVVGSSVAGMAQYMIPIFGTTLSVILLGENIENYHLAGIAVIFVGVWLVTSGRKPEAAAGRKPDEKT
jgi:drug/metabolite transporter (DMT)-like permease